MIIPRKDAKSYGVVHIQEYFSFLGFSKRIDSDEIQQVDIYLDNELTDTIIANKVLNKIDAIYDIKGHSFVYSLPNKYINTKKTISFRNHETQEELQNSYFKLINHKHSKFNEMALLNSIKNYTNKDITTEYTHNCIGFLATKENLADTEFLKYIIELSIKIPNIKIKGFYLNKLDLNETRQSLEKNNIIFLPLNNLQDLLKGIEIFLLNHNIYNQLEKIITPYIKDKEDIFISFFSSSHKDLSIGRWEEIHKKSLEKIINNITNSTDFIIHEKRFFHFVNNQFLLFNKEIHLPITSSDNFFNFFNIKLIEYILSSKKFKKFYNTILVNNSK